MCGFVLVACFAWLVGLLCACGVRRFKGLRRISLDLSLYLPFFLSLYLLFVLLSFFALVVFLLSSCIVFVALWVWLLFPFPLRTIRKKKGRKFFASSLVLLCVALSCCCFVFLFGYSAALGITKLLQAVSILNELPEIQATEN